MKKERKKKKKKSEEQSCYKRTLTKAGGEYIIKDKGILATKVRPFL